ncbi:uncharacterized protein UV8b_00798 [Ustilaginoidea virens]|uniref:Uncharacterized protein n=1 Tax=Ustilaginoidea virens TaxID=1159556 RepID=A0A8E5HJR9_USTVR|nr:uncharacterized protein UV8b_00798 [Ustilaginoidea virens]QUC16557.1 hypothetical protein UV8b_00798 [Ustilaginoidea virens]
MFWHAASTIGRDGFIYPTDYTDHTDRTDKGRHVLAGQLPFQPALVLPAPFGCCEDSRVETPRVKQTRQSNRKSARLSNREASTGSRKIKTLQ